MTQTNTRSVATRTILIFDNMTDSTTFYDVTNRTDDEIGILRDAHGKYINASDDTDELCELLYGDPGEGIPGIIEDLEALNINTPLILDYPDTRYEVIFCGLVP